MLYGKQIFRVYFSTFCVEVVEERQRENQGTRDTKSRCRMVDSSALLKGFQVAHVLGWLMDLQFVTAIEIMKD